MSPESIINLVLGNAGVVVVLLLLVYALVSGRYLVPEPVHRAIVKRADLLDAENAEQNDTITDLVRQKGAQEVQVARLEEEVSKLRGEVQRLTREVVRLGGGG